MAFADLRLPRSARRQWTSAGCRQIRRAPTAAEKTVVWVRYPCVCPEPVLVKHNIILINVYKN